MTFITTFNFVTYILTALAVAAFGLYGWLWFTGGFKPAKLFKSIVVTNVANLLFTIATIALCFVDFRATCTFMFWSTVATLPIGIVAYYMTKGQIKKLLADAATASQYPQAYANDPVDAYFAASK